MADLAQATRPMEGELQQGAYQETAAAPHMQPGAGHPGQVPRTFAGQAPGAGYAGEPNFVQQAGVMPVVRNPEEEARRAEQREIEEMKAAAHEAKLKADAEAFLAKEKAKAEAKLAKKEAAIDSHTKHEAAKAAHHEAKVQRKVENTLAKAAEEKQKAIAAATQKAEQKKAIEKEKMEAQLAHAIEHAHAIKAGEAPANPGVMHKIGAKMHIVKDY